MEQTEILKKAIEKAVKSKFDVLKFVGGQKWEVVTSSVGLQVVAKYTCSNPACWHSVDYNAEKVIFSHDFAKAFWGEEFINANVADGFIKPLNHKEYGATMMIDLKLRMKAWRFHLWQMVISEDPIKYLEQFIVTKQNGTN